MPRADRPPRHVLMTADAVGGVWTFACDLARALGARDVDVSLAVLGPAASARQRDQITRLPRVTVYEHPGRLEWMADPWSDVTAAGEWLMRLADALRPDIVHLNGLCHGALPWPAPVLVTGHSCVVSWWRAVHGSEPPSSWARYVEEVARSLRAARMVVAPTGAMLAMLDAEYGPLPAAAVIANGRDAPAARMVPKEPFVLTAGRVWDEAKNVPGVCAAAPLLSWPVRVAGETRSPDGATVPCEDVDFLGRLDADDLAAWMARASIYTLPARYEPFGLSVLEAAQAGCALVLGDLRSLREIWGAAAVFVQPDNRRMLAAAIETLIADADHRARMAARAAARAGALTAGCMAERYLAAYASLCAAEESGVERLAAAHAPLTA